jgi:hypothetical protein
MKGPGRRQACYGSPPKQENTQRKQPLMLAFRSVAYLIPILAPGLGPKATLSTQIVPRFGLEVGFGQFRQS